MGYTIFVMVYIMSTKELRSDWIDKIDKIIKIPHIQVTVGLLLLSMSISELFIKPKHGFILLGFYHIAQQIPNILQALERIARWKPKRRRD